ncbi:sensor histidine kinase [Telmatospirillum sp. J64-1]|uniref:sensor histidine kinase n=1 Tax=Telmatospirillum sp. J64-1 TaxID=2502183 RepID=UPI00115F1587|nr:hybrid sensor histidine kinase/response regulator [Telmatospirillum sp. J64-1]
MSDGDSLLIIDDDVTSIRALTNVLDYEHIRFATSGSQGLELARSFPPSLILLDVLMPEMDGYQVCARLKADPATRDIPVIFITSLSSPEEEARGLELGAVDYVTKPFSPAIVQARVATHLSLRRANEFLRNKNQILEALVEERSRKLAEAQREKMEALRQMVAGVAHQINTPIGVALGSVSSLTDQISRLSDKINGNHLRRADLEAFLQNAKDLADLVTENVRRAGHLVQYFKQVAAESGGSNGAFNLGAFLQETMEALKPRWAAAGHSLRLSCPNNLVLESYPAVLVAVIEQLLANALDHAYAPGESGRLSLTVEEAGEGEVLLRFADDGRGIPAEIRPKIFAPFFTTARARGSVGLGLNIVYNLVTESLGGSIEVLTPERGGCEILLRLGKSLPPRD